MKFNVVQNRVLDILNNYRKHDALPGGERIELHNIAAECQTRHLTEQFQASKKQDQKEPDLSKMKGVVHTSRGPSEKEWLERSVETKTEIQGTTKKGEMLTHELATLKGEDEPYQEIYEYTQFNNGNIRHITIAVLGDGGVGCGGIVSKAEFLTPEPGKSWREESQINFLGQDLISIYNQGTYKPQI